MAHRKLSQCLSANAALFVAAGVAVGSFNATRTDPTQVENRKRTYNNFFLVGTSANSATESQQLGRFPAYSFGTSSLHTLCEGVKSETESQRFERVLAYHLSQIASYRRKWEYTADSSATTATKTPSRSWPDDVPSTEDLPWLLEDVKYCARSPNFRSDKDYCSRLSFRVASALLVQFEEESQERGFEILKKLAETGYPDAMVYYGMCLNDGRANRDPNSDAAVSWFKRCSDMYEHPQSQYELGVASYTGEGVVEDEGEAVRLFQLAAEQSHPAACYMLGDCLLDGVGVEIDRGLALEWLVRAAELGHRGARSRVMAVLEKKEGEDYGLFSDASRQTYIERTVLTANKEGQIVQRRATLRKEIGGGSRNPTELARRQTIVSKSREEA
mmetsp:Transcript_30817/g.65113  ORF Transcript_30817/g.65113 Transcript_30817/m.65113 type:complete len:387 (-) Transcript_30817:2701-3861(-)